MIKEFDVISIGELVVEFFRSEVDKPFDQFGNLLGPFPSGAPAIFIDTIAKLGGKCGFIGTIGRDDFGQCILNRLKKDNIDIRNIVEVDGVGTGCAFTAYFSDGNRKFVYFIGNEAPGMLNHEHIDEDYIKKSRWLHISGNVLAFSESAKEAVFKAIDIAYQNDIPISLDPNLRLEIMKKEEIEDLLLPVLEKATIFLPSEGEISCITGVEDDETGICGLLNKGIKVVARKEGANGCTIFTKNEKLHVDTFNDVNVVDVTGCGDSFGAAFIYGYLKGWNLRMAGIFANAVGSITATQKGAMEGIKSLDEVKRFLKERNIKLSKECM